MEEVLMSELLEEAEGVSMVNKLISTVYSGPTISDIESALSFTDTGGGHGHGQLAADDSHAPAADPHHPAPRKYDDDNSAAGQPPAAAVSRAVLWPASEPAAEKVVLSKMENKYTLKMKTSCSGGGLAEDGYKWRKYGQKSIKNSPNPRSYYRCTNPRCNAKKQVERATDEADTLLVTYEGLHLHYTYSHFLHSQAQAQAQATKKPKIHPRVAGPAQDITSRSPSLTTMLQDADGDDASFQQDHQEAAAAAAAADNQDDDDYYYYTAGGGVTEIHHHQEEPMTTTNGGGLLEDVVRPLLMARRRRPCTRTATSSPPPSLSASTTTSSSSSLVSWNNNPTSPYIDMAILSNIF